MCDDWPTLMRDSHGDLKGRDWAGQGGTGETEIGRHWRQARVMNPSGFRTLEQLSSFCCVILFSKEVTITWEK